MTTNWPEDTFTALCMVKPEYFKTCKGVRKRGTFKGLARFDCVKTLSVKYNHTGYVFTPTTNLSSDAIFEFIEVISTAVKSLGYKKSKLLAEEAEGGFFMLGWTGNAFKLLIKPKVGTNGG